MGRGNEGSLREKVGKVHRELGAVGAQAGWRAFIYTVEVVCRDYTETSPQQFLKSLGLTGSMLRKAIKDLAEVAEHMELLALAQKKGQGMGKARILGLAADPPAWVFGINGAKHQ